MSEINRMGENYLLELDPQLRVNMLALGEQELAMLPDDSPKVPKTSADQLDSAFSGVAEYPLIRLKLKMLFGPLKNIHAELLAEFGKLESILGSYQ